MAEIVKNSADSRSFLCSIRDNMLNKTENSGMMEKKSRYYRSAKRRKHDEFKRTQFFNIKRFHF